MPYDGWIIRACGATGADCCSRHAVVSLPRVAVVLPNEFDDTKDGMDVKRGPPGRGTCCIGSGEVTPVYFPVGPLVR